MKKNIYLDNNASCPLDPEVALEIAEFLKYPVINPSSTHYYGQQARALLDKARREIAAYLQVLSKEIIFTSSGTEAMNFLIKSALAVKDGAIISSDLEHSAVYNFVKARPSSVMIKGVPTLESVENAITPETALIVLMAVNNETGVKLDLENIAALARSKNIPLIIDGVAWLGKEAIHLPKGVKGIGFSGHKIHAPTGIGCAVFREGLKPLPLIVGGAQEYGYRAGTENMLGILGFAKAISLLNTVDFHKIKELRDRFEGQLLSSNKNLAVNGSEFNRTTNVSNILFPGEDAETLMMKLDQLGIACSLGSACTSGAIEPSRILLAMGLSYKEAKASIRFSFSRMNTIQEVDQAAEIILSLV